MGGGSQSVPTSNKPNDLSCITYPPGPASLLVEWVNVAALSLSYRFFSIQENGVEQGHSGVIDLFLTSFALIHCLAVAKWRKH